MADRQRDGPGSGGQGPTSRLRPGSCARPGAFAVTAASGLSCWLRCRTRRQASATAPSSILAKHVDPQRRLPGVGVGVALAVAETVDVGRRCVGGGWARKEGREEGRNPPQRSAGPVHDLLPGISIKWRDEHPPPPAKRQPIARSTPAPDRRTPPHRTQVIEPSIGSTAESWRSFPVGPNGTGERRVCRCTIEGHTREVSRG